MNQQIKILIAGGTGLIGQRLTTLLQLEGFSVSYLSRKEGITNGIKCFKWDPTANSIDVNALDGITHIINLAGESIAGNRWTDSFKEKIIQSRLNASATILNALKKNPNQVKAIIGSSAIGVYGDRKDQLLTENSKAGNGFLSETVVKWEASYNEFKVRTVLLRLGIVLSKEGGALVPMSTPIKFGIVPILGSGNQWMSWIHIDDVCGLIIHAIKNENMQGVYNSVAPNPVTHRIFMLSLRSILNKFSIPFPVPSFLLKIMMGEQKAIVTDSVNVSSRKSEELGYVYQFSKLKIALKNIYEQ